MTLVIIELPVFLDPSDFLLMMSPGFELSVINQMRMSIIKEERNNTLFKDG